MGKVIECRDELVKSCSNCENSTRLCDDGKMLCKLKGVVSEEYLCTKYKFDPLKYIPSPRIPLSKVKYNPE